jgi:membrane-bound lytic murein transglycosylase A
VLLLAAAGCATPRPPAMPEPAAAAAAPTPCPPPAVPAPAPSCPAPAPEATAPRPAPAVRLEPVAFQDLPGWADDDVAAGFQAFLRGCPALRNPPWAAFCAKAQALATADAQAQRRFLEANAQPHRVLSSEGIAEGLLTGYYEPLLRGSRNRDGRYRVPLYGPPDDLVSVELTELYPELKGLRLRGRVVGRKLVPYHTRADIDNGTAPLRGRELIWVDDPVDAFFLQVQGSGRVRLDSGELVRVGYADQNGHAYRSVGRLLVERGELTLDQASMQGIRAWGQRNPQKLAALLNENPSYVFFRELPAGDGGPPGSLGVPLSNGRSLAVDPRAVPLGAPVFVSSTWPGTARPLNRLMAAQDTGGAIRGAVRADYFWGFGEEAGELAGRMRQPLLLWVLLPRAEATP